MVLRCVETQPILTIQVHAQTVLLTNASFPYHSGLYICKATHWPPLPPCPTLKAESLPGLRGGPNPAGCSGGGERREPVLQRENFMLEGVGGVGESECQCVVCGGIGHLLLSVLSPWEILLIDVWAVYHTSQLTTRSAPPFHRLALRVWH